MKVVVDPAWSLLRTVEAARDAYVGGGKTSRGYRLSVLMVWGNVVGRRRANQELNALLLEAGSDQTLAEELGISRPMLRKLARHFKIVPDHWVAATEPGRDLSTLNNFVFLERGGYGQVWKATDALGRHVAVKFMTAATTELEKAVLAHAAPLAALGQHPNVVLVYYCDGVEHPTTRLRVPAMVMEFIEGISLGQLLRENISFERAVAIGLAVSAGLLHIHGKGLTHGDLHDDNVMIPSAGDAKLIDLVNDKTISELTSGTRRLGTNDDVEALKALLTNLLRKTPEAALATVFDAAVRIQTTVAGVKATFDEVTRLTPAPAPPIAEFLSAWGELERIVEGRNADGPVNNPVGPRRSIPSLVERLDIEPSVRNEFNALRRIRNTAVHGGPSNVDRAVVARTRRLVGVLRNHLQTSLATPRA
jgi:tRNA A-37 threonylcarbamoyl transferase component Bud32